MKIQVNILFEIIRKNFFWLVFLFILVFCKTLSILFTFNTQEVENQFLSLISMPQNFSILNIYQLVLIVYITYRFYVYEFKNSFENVILRANEKKWILNKMITVSIIAFLVRLIDFFVPYLLFSKEINLNINYFLTPFLYHYAIALCVVLITNLFREKQIITFLVSIISTYLIFMYLWCEAVLILLVLTIIFNLYIFKFKILSNET